MTLPDPVGTLLAARRLEQVPPDRASAGVRLSRAEDRLDSAKQIAHIDVDIAYVTAYATRIAVTAHMLANGYRQEVAGSRPAGRADPE